MSELLRSVMAECAEMARSGRRAAAFGGCAHGQLGAAMAVASEQGATPEATRPAPVLVHDRVPSGGLDSVLPIVLPAPDRRPRSLAGQPLPGHRAA